MSLGLVKTPQPPSVLSMGVQMRVQSQWGPCPMAVVPARFRTAYTLCPCQTPGRGPRAEGRAASPILGAHVVSSVVAVGLGRGEVWVRFPEPKQDLQ